MSEEYRDKYMEQRFQNILEQGEHNHQILLQEISKLTKEVKETNGKVKNHEGRIKAIEEENLGKTVDDIQKEQDKIAEETDAVRFFRRHPKLLMFTIVGSVLISGSAVILTILRILNFI